MATYSSLKDKIARASLEQLSDIARELEAGRFTKPERIMLETAIAKRVDAVRETVRIG